MAEQWMKKPVEWSIKDIGAPLLDSLAGGLYSPLEVFREYVQNAVDSYVDFQRYTALAPKNTVQVWLDANNASLHVRDDGLGMDWVDINTAKAIAVSHKLARFTEFVGFRGLGIWSGLSACDQLVLTTTKFGVSYGYRLTIDCKGIVEHLQDPIPIDELLQDRVDIHESEWDTEDHFTQVKLVNIHPVRFRELLDVEAITRYAERYLPVPLDPTWKYRDAVQDALKDVPWTANYVLTINGQQVYRRFPPVSDIKPPERHVIDDGRRPVAVAWLCETNRRSQKKAIEEKGWVRNFAVRVKNFTVGQRGLYTAQGVTDPGNLDWFVGEIYVTDPNIKPDTKRLHFQPGPRHDDVIKAMRKFYTSVALRARGWSALVNAEEDSEQVKYWAGEIEKILTNSALTLQEKELRLQSPYVELEKLRKKLEDVREEANKTDTEQTAESALILRSYLRKLEVKQAVDSALGMIAMIKKRLQQLPSDEAPRAVSTTTPAVNASITTPIIKDKPSKARTKRLQGSRVNAQDALSTQAVVGILPEFELLPPVDESKGQLVDLSTAIEAFKAAVAAVVGEETEQYRRIMDQVAEELRRRGINV